MIVTSAMSWAQLDGSTAAGTNMEVSHEVKLKKSEKVHLHGEAVKIAEHAVVAKWYIQCTVVTMFTSAHASRLLPFR